MILFRSSWSDICRDFQGLVLVDIASGTTVRKYFGLQQSDYQINSCFGGANEQFILSGSEG